MVLLWKFYTSILAGAEIEVVSPAGVRTFQGELWRTQ